MKQLIPLSFSLFLLPCLAWAQYPSNGNQKITLGEQTTADGLIWRGVATDTTLTVKSDTAAYFVLDTVNINLYTYKASATGKKWIQLGSDTTSLNLVSRFATKLNISDTASMLTPYWRAGRFSGTLPVVNGGTNATTLTANKVMIGNGTSGVLTPTNLHWDNTNSRLGVNTLNPVDKLDVTGGFKISKATFVAPTSGSGLEWSFRTDNVGYLTAYDRDNAAYRSLSMGLANFNVDTDADGNPNFTVRQTSGEAWIGYTADQGAYKLQINGQPYATSSLFVPSDLRFKENIQPLDKGLEIINKLKPVKFNFISTTENNFSEFDEIGFIAQDVEGALSTELFAKAVVKKLDEDKDDSALGLMTEKLIPILVKAIQEQQALIKALEQRIINLENK